MIWPKNKLTRFEVTRIIGARTLQISLGAPLLIKSSKKNSNSMQLAEEEFKQKKVPMTIKRTFPNDETVIIDIKKGIENWLEDHHGNII